ncbi:MAG: branched-chain amino acid ABC transporter permease [SAR324 cluster bacterium]|nr:branched-chain amino acid ABC transporter permease [SAR324 cluster bacterium]
MLTKGMLAKELKINLGLSLWMVFLTFPLVALKVDYLDKTLVWHLDNLLWVALSSFLISGVWRYFLHHYQPKERLNTGHRFSFAEALANEKAMLFFLCLLSISPLLTSTYQTSILITAMMYIALGLGLNIVVGMAGLLDLGYVAFYACGAYAYGLLNQYYGLGFWQVLLVGGFMAAFLGVILGFPVLRLRGDYLAIVTLGFGEIIRMVLENEEELTSGPSGIANIPKPSFFGAELSYHQNILFLFYIMLAILLLAIVITRRLQLSRIGRAWMAIRENEIAAEAMGIDLTKTKLTAFGIGAFWAGVVGVVFAAKSSFINPASFAFHESAIILSIVVLGGMGSILGVVLAALILVLLPEYLRFLAEYRMLFFGAIMVIMMVFRPQGLISRMRAGYDRDPEMNAGENLDD